MTVANIAQCQGRPLKKLRPFFSYMGSKFRLARTYPPPRYNTIIEPFAGSAGYSTFWNNRNIVLNDIDPVIAGVWDYLIESSASDIMELPIAEHFGDINILTSAKHFIGLNVHTRNIKPNKKYSKWSWKHRDNLHHGGLWNAHKRACIAGQVGHIKHWSISCLSFDQLDNDEATWFIDPPYEYLKIYEHSKIDYSDLRDFCLTRKGQVIVCENEKATWLPFNKNRSVHRNSKSLKQFNEVVWTND